MIRQQTTRGLGCALTLLLASLAPATTALAQGGDRSVDGSHTGVGYRGLELDGGVVGSQPVGIGSRFGGSTSGGYARPGSSPAPAAPPARSVAPYLTTRTYEPGDGYRYPLYFNPATGGYFYHPVRR